MFLDDEAMFAITSAFSLLRILYHTWLRSAQLSMAVVYR